MRSLEAGRSIGEGENLHKMGCNKPTRDPGAKRKCVIDPVLWIIFFFLTFNGFMVRETIRSMVFFCGNMDKFKVEEKDSGNPSIDCCIRLYVRIM
jgi:hypothetical protein